ncbi:hypothetical protein [Agrococcus carbonis]|uniref:Uncharacterized protein n=1 Tax=Agrococcus carbonis TaxID=684552 RepID=A0A1H1N2U2_9MICO|nr:hypothetical protein [Agrococcus carbonis]SDR93373.1 hypothetical protein SAMN04489719_1156 [Agrococcus carbonis]
MGARRARLGIGHALACLAHGVAVAALVTDAASRPGAAVALALGAACAVAAAAVGLLAPPRVPTRALLVAAAALAVVAAAAGGALALLDLPPHAGVAAALGLAAGLHTAAIVAAAESDPPLAPRVRPAPTLLAAGTGAALVAVAELVPQLAEGWPLVVAAVLQLAALAVGASSGASASDAEPDALASAAAEHAHPAPALGGTLATTGSERAATAAAAPPRGASDTSDELGASGRSTAGRAPLGAPAPLLALLALAVAGATALAALRPALSAIGVEQPQPAGPLALTLMLGALLGPPLARLAEQLPTRAGATLATAGGAAALVAPIARPGTLDVVAATLLGVALAASVALVELARRRGARVRRPAPTLLALAGAAGAVLAALLLAAVPLPDVVLGAALACLVAGVGAWVPR